MVYNVKGMWWNGHDFDAITKDCKTKSATIGAVSQLIREIKPYQIMITDLDNKEPIPNDLLGIAGSLNSDEDIMVKAHRGKLQEIGIAGPLNSDEGTTEATS